MKIAIQFNNKNTYITKFMNVTSILTQATVTSIKLCIVLGVLHLISIVFNLIFCYDKGYMYMLYVPIALYSIITILLIYKCIRPNEISAMTKSISGDAYNGMNVNEERIEAVVERTYEIIGQVKLLQSILAIDIIMLFIAEALIWLFRFIL